MNSYAKPLLLNKIKASRKKLHPRFSGFETNNKKYFLYVRRNGLITILDTKTLHYLHHGIDPKNLFNKRRNRNIIPYINEYRNMMRVNKVNYTNKKDPITLHDFRPGEYAYRVKTGGLTAYYQPSTIYKLSKFSKQLFNTTLSKKFKVFDNPLLGYNNRGQKFPVYRKNIRKVRLVKPQR